MPPRNAQPAPTPQGADPAAGDVQYPRQDVPGDKAEACKHLVQARARMLDAINARASAGWNADVFHALDGDICAALRALGAHPYQIAGILPRPVQTELPVAS